jgi:glucokinase
MLARTAAVGGRLRAVVRTVGEPDLVRGEDVQDAARAGDEEALAVIDEFGRWVATGLVNLTNAVDPELFVLGGGLARGADLYLGPIVAWFERLIYQPHLRPQPRIEFAEFGPLAGAVGAALLPTDR